MNHILFDGFRRNNLLPLTYMRPVADIRIGILTIREKWEKYLGQKTYTLTEPYLRKKYPIIQAEDNLMINGSVCPNPSIIKDVLNLKMNEVLTSDWVIIAMRVPSIDIDKPDEDQSDAYVQVETSNPFIKLNNTWDIFHYNDIAIAEDFELLTRGRKSQPVSSTNHVIGNRIFIEEGARIEFSIINSERGPVYIGKNAEIMEGSLIRGPFALGEGSTLKMGAKIYGPTTIGPYCKVGGEINNSVFFGYSNKAHDGFMGQSVIAEWCNIGADTNTSNLKNTYDNVKIWDYADKTFVETGLNFCGLIMGDHSKCGINTMFNTGTIVGISSNIFGSGYQRNFVPSFVWGGPSGFRPFSLDKAMAVASRVYERREKVFDQTEQELLRDVYELSNDHQI